MAPKSAANKVNGRTTRRKRPASPSPPPALKMRRAPARRKAAPVVNSPAHEDAPGEQWLGNPLPLAPTHERPSWQVFCWGAGDSGQLGMGADVLAVNLAKPRRNQYMETVAAGGAFGGPEAGIESVAAGALHSVFVDEKGTVSCNLRVLAIRFR